MSNISEFAAITDNRYFDAELNEWDETTCTQTQETLDEFIASSKGWAQRSAMTSGEIAGIPFIAWEQMQGVKGQPRTSLSVIDLGTHRVAIECDLEDYI